MPPAPGSYRRERIMRAPDGIVLDSDGSVRRLSEFTNGKITLFSFIRWRCAAMAAQKPAIGAASTGIF